MIKQKSGQFQLRGKRLLLKKDVTRKKGLIVLPKEEKDQTAIVHAVGTEIDVDIFPVGGRVIVGQFTGTEYEFEDGTFTLCFEEHIMGIQVKE